MRPKAVALRVAAVEGNIEEVTRIVSRKKYPVNGFIGDAWRPRGLFSDPTVLTVAAENGNKELIWKALELGGDVYIDGVKEDPDCQDAFISDDYFGAMVIAAVVGHFDIVSSLGEYRLFQSPTSGAVFKLKSADSDSPYADFVTSAKQGDFDKLESLLSSPEDKSKSESESMLAGWKGHNLMSLFLLHQCPSWCLQSMVDHGIGVNGWDFNGLTPLMCAILSGELENVEFLINKGADVYAPFVMGHTCFREDGTVVDEDGGILPTASSSYWSRDHSRMVVGPTALMIAASVRNIPILKLLLQKAQDHIIFSHWDHLSGYTPLMYAVYYGNLESVSVILNHEAARNYPFHKPFKFAIGLHKTDVIDLLLERISRQNRGEGFELSVGLHAIGCKCPQYLTKILESYGKEFDESDDGASLFSAIDADAFSCADILFNRPAFNIDKKCYTYGQTGLMYACQRGKHEFVQLLINMGAKIDLTNNEGKTAAMIAVEEKHVKCLELLIVADVDLDIVDDLGGTVFSTAIAGDESCMALLLKSGKLLVGKERKLKLVHTNSLKVYEDEDWLFFPNIRNIILSIEHEIFEWDWCYSLQLFLKSIAFAVVSSGVSPGKFVYRGYQLSLLLFAFVVQDVATIRYLVANLYFLPEDYQFLLNDMAMKQIMTFSYPSELSFLVELITGRLLTLQSWSFLTISKALSLSIFT